MASGIDGEKLRDARQALGLTQHELARRVGVAGGERISRWERGESRPRLEHLRRLATELDIPLTSLILVDDGDVADLRSLRHSAGLDVSELVALVNLTEPTYLRWESGAWVRLPSASVVAALSRAFKTSSEAVTAGLRQSQRDYQASRRS